MRTQHGFSSSSRGVATMLAASATKLRAGARVVVSSLALCAMAAVAGSLIAPPAAFAADKKPERISSKVGAELKGVNEALAAQDYAKVLAMLDKAEAVEKKTPFDQFKIDELRAHVYLTQKNFAQVLPIYAKFLDSAESQQYMDPKAVEILPKQLTQLSFQLQMHDKVQDYGKRWLSSHPDDTQIIDLLGRSRYMTKDYQGSLQLFQSAIGVAEKAGKTPEEIWMQLVVSSAANLDDEQTINGAYRKLVRYHPKTDHWSKLLERSLYSEKNDLGTLYTFRLMSDVGVFTKPEQYMEYAQLALEKAFPGEAHTVLQAGFDKGVLGTGPEKDRQQRSLAELKQKAEADRKQLPQFEKEAKGPKSNGQMLAGLGYAYYSVGQYAEAIEAINAGLVKGGVRNADDARMLLGVSYLKAGQKDQARAQFEAIAASSPLANAAQLWAIRTYN